MTPDPVTIDDRATVAAAQARMTENGIRHLPVLRDGQVVGVISERDLREMRPWLAVLGGATRGFREAIDAVEVGAIMSRPCHTIGPDAPLDEAARVMYDARIGALPIVADGRLVGVLTLTDLLGVLLAMLGRDTDGGREVLPLVPGGPPLWEWLRRLTAEGRTPSRVATVPSRDGRVTHLVVHTTTDAAPPSARPGA